MTGLTKTIALTLAALSGLVSFSGDAIAKDVTAEEAAMRVNIAGRQRMLSQRIAMSSCFVNAGVFIDDNLDRLTSAFEEFSTMHRGLLHGDESLGLHKEGYRSVVEALNAVDQQWSVYSDLVATFITVQRMTPEAMVSFNQSSVNVLTDMNIAVGTIASSYSADLENLPQILAVTIDFAGRQRMLTQKMAKEYCLISVGVNVEENREALAQSHEMFTLTLQALKDGIPNLITAAPTPEILAILNDVERLWGTPDALFQKAIAGEPIMPQDRHTISQEIDLVLRRMNDAVKLYESVDGLPNF